MVNKRLKAEKKLRNFRIQMWACAVVSTLGMVAVVIAAFGGFRAYVMG